LMIFFFFQAEDGIRDFHVTGVQTCALPISVIIGLELEVNAGELDAGNVLELDLAELLSDPLLDFTVWALYSDGSKKDVTEGAAITTDDPLLTVDGPGLLQLAGVLVAALTDPEHYLHAEYEGFRTDVTLRIVTPDLGDLPIVGLKLHDVAPGAELDVGTHLPHVLALLDDGAGGTVELLIPPGYAGVEWNIQPRLLDCALLDAV